MELIEPLLVREGGDVSGSTPRINRLKGETHLISGSKGNKLRCKQEYLV